MTEIPQGDNRLALEHSPYLLQHAHNPVDWYPWGEEAFEKARVEDKPIFLSIGYSTCHWCHVMEHESFEDSTVAALMNAAFVSIKVDREERPDIDNVYMTVCQMMTGRGGWPLTIFMTPDRKPFFSATYIPKDDRFGQKGLKSLIGIVDDMWKNRREELLQASIEVTENLQKTNEGKHSHADLTVETLKLAYTQLEQRFDSQHGGFGESPKFPTPHNLLFLLRYWKRTGEARALEMVEKTLTAMSQGGMYDHVGFGFHRYSTDERWFAPHFEKMLYDQALLVMAYSEAYVATGNATYRRVGEEIIQYVLRDMVDAKGGFYSAEDADSEGIEGKFYLWSVEELRSLLGDADATFIMDLYGAEEKGNFHAEVPGGNILHLPQSMADVATARGTSEGELRDRFEKIRSQLFKVRENRVHPGKDDKILTDWNGLMIAALAKAARAFNKPEYKEAAERSARFVLDELREDDGSLIHRYRGGHSGIQAQADDYAFMTWGLIELYESTFDVEYLRAALELNTYLIDHFWDADTGGLFFTPSNGEGLIARMKEVYDGAVPSANSVAMFNFIRLGRLTAQAALEQRSSEIGNAFYADVSKAASAFSMLLVALDFGIGPSFEIVIVGQPGAADTREMNRVLDSVYVPNKVVLFKPLEPDRPEITKLAAFTEAHAAIDGRATAYVCRNYACELPTTDTGEMLKLLQGN